MWWGRQPCGTTPVLAYVVAAFNAFPRVLQCCATRPTVSRDTHDAPSWFVEGGLGNGDLEQVRQATTRWTKSLILGSAAIKGGYIGSNGEGSLHRRRGSGFMTQIATTAYLTEHGPQAKGPAWSLYLQLQGMIPKTGTIQSFANRSLTRGAAR